MDDLKNGGINYPEKDQISRQAQGYNFAAQFEKHNRNKGVYGGQKPLALTPHTVSELTTTRHEEKDEKDGQIEDYQELDDVYSPGQLYPAESSYDPIGYQENRNQFAPRQMNQNNFPREPTDDQEENAELEHQQHQFRNKEESDNRRNAQQHPPSRFLSAKQPNQDNVSSSSLGLQPQGSQSSLIKQFSEKIKTQAERLQKLETYKKLCERRILDFDQNHAFPITEDMIGSPSEMTRDPQYTHQTDYKRQLALKEQDLMYAKQRAEKAFQENEYLRQELESAKMRQSQSDQPAGKFTVDRSANTSELLQKRVQMLEEEKNALLDYIEESVNQTQNASILQQSTTPNKSPAQQDTNAHKNTINDLQAQVKQLMAQNKEISYFNEELRSKLNELELKNQLNSFASGRGMDTFGNLATGLSTRSPQEQTLQSQGGLLSQALLPQVQNIDYMVLDLNAVKQELMDTQNQFNTTQNMLTAERQEKQELLSRLEDINAQFQQLQQQLEQQTQKIQNPWQNSANSQIYSRAFQEAEGSQDKEAKDFEYKVKLVEERDRLLDQKSQLQDKLVAQVEECKILKNTLDETQHELEQLVNEHERVTAQVQDLQTQMKEAQDLPRRLRQEAQGIRDQLDERTNEVHTLQSEIKNLSRQAEMNMDTLKQLKAHNLQLEAQLVEIRDSDEMKAKTQHKQWEMTIEDLTKELKFAQANIVEKENIYQKIERELRAKLHEVDDAHTAKSTLLRRIEDLNHEVRSHQVVSERKDSKIKEQTRQLEEMAFEIEKLTIQLQKVSHEKEQTLELRKEDFGVLELTQQKVEKQGKVITKVCRDVKKVQELVNTLSKEFQLPNRIVPENPIPSQDTEGRRQSNHLDEQLRETNGCLKQIGDWLVQFAKTYKHAIKTIEIAQQEVESANRQVKVLESRCQTTLQIEFEAREKGRLLSQELIGLKAEVVDTQALQRDGYEREERIHKKNQQLKTQIEAVKIQKEKLQLQIKTLLAEKETLKENLESKNQETEETSEKSKMLELQISQLVEQKQSVLDLFTRFKEAFPSDSLRKVFGQIIDVVKAGFKLDEELAETENELLAKEGQLRKYAKREVEGLLSTKVINIRKEVEQGRHGLREMTLTKDELQVKLNELENELRQNETTERRRTDVALETEANLAQARNELQEVRKELIFVSRNRGDLEVALSASQQERQLVERELLTLRHQLKLKADLNPDNFKSASSARKMTSYNPTQSSLQTCETQIQRTQSVERIGQQHIGLRHREPQPTAQFPSMAEEVLNSDQPAHIYVHQKSDLNEMPLKRRFPSQEPAIYTSHANQPSNVVPRERTGQHQQYYSDLPLQMPSLTDRAGEKMRPSIYGGVMSGPGALATTNAYSIYENRPPSSKQQAAPPSSRPPTYQQTTSVSQRSGQNSGANITPFYPSQYQVADTYVTGDFAERNYDQTHTQTKDQSRAYTQIVSPLIPNYSVNTLRNTGQNSRSNSASALQTAGMLPQTIKNSHAHESSKVEPIISQYTGEVTSRSDRNSPARQRYSALTSGKASPLRRSPSRGTQPHKELLIQHPASNTIEEDSKLDQNAYMMHNSTQKSHSAYGAHNKSSVNESSIHNKLSALRNVFSQIRQNLDESSMTGTRMTNHQSSIEQSLIQNQEYC